MPKLKKAKPTLHAECNACGQVTKHRTLVAKTTNSDQFHEGVGYISFVTVNELLECCGCEAATFRVRTWNDVQDEEEWEYYPPRISRRIPLWHTQLPPDLKRLVKEIYAALQNGSPTLALLGSRAAIEYLAVEKVGDLGTFSDHLAALETQGFLSNKNREYLGAAVEAGHAAMHRKFNPSEETVSHVMDIVENLLQAVYALEKSSTALKKSVPGRK